MVDQATLVMTAASAFFVVLAAGLLFRYRQTSQQISASADLGRDLWGALEKRLKKQDERILDMMGKVEVIQSRVMERRGGGDSEIGFGPREAIRSTERRAAGALTESPSSLRSQGVVSRPEVSSEGGLALESRLNRQDARIIELMGRLDAIQSLLVEERVERPAAEVKARPPARVIAPPGGSTEKLVVEMLNEKPRTSVEIRQRFGISREHSARLLKSLFDRGLVVRNDSSKPFVYELTDAGRRYLSAG
jgi:predicted transcriptional regulator